ncbi:uncharacterized protein N7459_003572 [Penicillium hispanicum]|uniref:uncharacterized protein n=1 Tax=Penicillium hispanicum TaxID=1080232 RepID=UPI00254072DF|nr:uncharacterized protein N7459_003572 [Penicillium hispanicum]KAJ5587807.1 hypothetical protein N7459_003572 [Penicillium hispanicum]
MFHYLPPSANFHDVSQLMTHSLLGKGRDDFGAEMDTKRPLLLDSVMEGKSRISGSRLLTIPAEILANIVDFLVDDRPTLAALALVNSECRQLARSCQFVDICFDYSLQAFGLLRALLQESATRVHAVSHPTIGACIRRITVKSRPEFVVSAHRELYESVYGETRESCTNKRRNELRIWAFQQYLNYRSTLLMVISAAMPNLETIVWYDHICVDAHFFKVIAHSPIRHLKLSGISIAKPYLLEPPLTPTVMQLRSLYIEIDLISHPLLKNKFLSPFFEGLLRRCASTLESLVWYPKSYLQEGETISLGDEPIFFPHLRHLKLEFLQLTPHALSSFLSAPLRQLALPLFDETMENLLVKWESIRDLQTLVAPSLYNPKAVDALVSFLQKNTGLQKLCIQSTFFTTLDSQIIPLLSAGQFSNLVSLSLSWAPSMLRPRRSQTQIVTVAEESIAAIGTIVSLEQLCLTAGGLAGALCQWLVDHEMLRANLKGLTKLKKLAICRDTYQTDDTFHVERYYLERVLHDVDWSDARARPELDAAADVEDDDTDDDDIEYIENKKIWERAHRNRMLGHAEQYAATMPSLEWVFCGFWPMAIKERGDGTGKAAIPLREQKDMGNTSLKCIFAMG